LTWSPGFNSVSTAEAASRPPNNTPYWEPMRAP
jgi:hypothetical protein